MPIYLPSELRRPSQKEAGELCYELMNCIFALHCEMGRFFDETIYRCEIARRFQGSRQEYPISVAFEDFRRMYFADLLIGDCVLVELKAVERLADRHRSQLLNYLMMCDLPHGKLVNLRTEQVEHEFLNTTLRHSDRRRITIDKSKWLALAISDTRWIEWLMGAISEWGTGLDQKLYEDAAVHVLGGRDQVLRDVKVLVEDRPAGRQLGRYCGPDWVFRITTLQGDLTTFERHARSFLTNTALRGVQWINIAREQVTLTTLTKSNS